VPVPPDRVRDPREIRQPGIGLGRDPSRTPMPWNSSVNAGFSSVEPWLPLNPDWRTRNVATQDTDPGSMLHLTRNLLQLRREQPALSVGEYRPVACEGSLLAYERRCGSARFVIALNLGPDPVPMPDAAEGGRRVLSTITTEGDTGSLRGNEGVIVRRAD
jgi:alpha-glucosidase